MNEAVVGAAECDLTAEDQSSARRPETQAVGDCPKGLFNAAEEGTRSGQNDFAETTMPRRVGKRETPCRRGIGRVFCCHEGNPSSGPLPANLAEKSRALRSQLSTDSKA